MAEKKAKAMDEVDEAQAERARAAAESFAEAEKNKIDETVPGGRYIFGDVVKNAHGEIIEGLSVKDGKITGTEKK